MVSTPSRPVEQNPSWLAMPTGCCAFNKNEDDGKAELQDNGTSLITTSYMSITLSSLFTLSRRLHSLPVYLSLYTPYTHTTMRVTEIYATLESLHHDPPDYRTQPRGCPGLRECWQHVHGSGNNAVNHSIPPRCIFQSFRYDYSVARIATSMSASIQTAVHPLRRLHHRSLSFPVPEC